MATLRQEQTDIIAQLTDITSSLEENRDCGNWQTEKQLLEEQTIFLERLEQIRDKLSFLQN